MATWETWLFRLVFIAFVGWFAAQMATRYRLFMAAKDNLGVDDVPARLRRFVSEVVFQSKVIQAKPLVGFAHLFVFWGFVAFGLYTLVEFLRGLGIADLTGTTAFHYAGQFFVEVDGAYLIDDVPNEQRTRLRWVLEAYRTGQIPLKPSP